MKNWKSYLRFTLICLPLAAIGGWFLAIYQLDLYGEAMWEEILAQLGSVTLLCMICALQAVGYAAVCGFFGGWLADRVGLWRPIRIERRPVVVTLAVSVVFGILFSLDYWTFGALMPALREGTEAGLTFAGMVSAILYGGIVEELLLRLFFMSGVAWGITKLTRKTGNGVLIAANAVAALLFAAGHLPATAAAFGALTPLLLIRCFLLNGGFGFWFGELYRRYGILYAMFSHMLLHMVSRVIWAAAL